MKEIYRNYLDMDERALLSMYYTGSKYGTIKEIEKAIGEVKWNFYIEELMSLRDKIMKTDEKDLDSLFEIPDLYL